MKNKVFSILALLLMAVTGAQAEVIATKIYTMDYSTESTYPFNLNKAEGSAAMATVSDGQLVLYNPAAQTEKYHVQPEIGRDFTIRSGYTYRVKIDYKTTVAGYVNIVLGTWNEFGAYWWYPITVSDEFQTIEADIENFSYNNNASETHILFQFGDLVGTINIKKVEVYEIQTCTLTANSDGAATPSYWATYYNSAQGYTADANTTVYQAAVSGSSLALTEVAGREIPKGEAVILKSSAESITLMPATTTAASLSGNQLKGGTEVTSGYDAYTLSRGSAGNGAIGFYKYSGTTLDGSKAHLEVASSAGARTRGFIGFGDGTTAIEAPTATVSIKDGETYDLTGRRIVGQPARKGIYVRNGKKFIIK